MLWGGHSTDPLSIIAYLSVISRDRFKISSMRAALNDIHILACDIGNANLNVSPRKRFILLHDLSLGWNWKENRCLQSEHGTLPKAQQPLPSCYYSKLDITPCIHDDNVNIYRSFIFFITLLGSSSVANRSSICRHETWPAGPTELTRAGTMWTPRDSSCRPLLFVFKSLIRTKK